MPAAGCGNSHHRLPLGAGGDGALAAALCVCVWAHCPLYAIDLPCACAPALDLFNSLLTNMHVFFQQAGPPHSPRQF